MAFTAARTRNASLVTCRKLSRSGPGGSFSSGVRLRHRRPIRNEPNSLQRGRPRRAAGVVFVARGAGFLRRLETVGHQEAPVLRARESGAPPAARIRSARRSLLWRRARPHDPYRRRACPRIARLPAGSPSTPRSWPRRWLARSRARVNATISAEDDDSPAAGGRSDTTAASTPAPGAPFAAHGLGRRAQVVLPIARRHGRELRRPLELPEAVLCRR